MDDTLPVLNSEAAPVGRAVVNVTEVAVKAVVELVVVEAVVVEAAVELVVVEAVVELIVIEEGNLTRKPALVLGASKATTKPHHKIDCKHKKTPTLHILKSSSALPTSATN